MATHSRRTVGGQLRCPQLARNIRKHRRRPRNKHHGRNDDRYSKVSPLRNYVAIVFEIPPQSLFFFLLSLALSLAIVVPVTGALVRFRANYNPKGLQLDAEGGVQPHTGPVVSTFFGMLKRVYRIEVSAMS